MPPPESVFKKFGPESDDAETDDEDLEFTATFYDLSKIPGLPTTRGFDPFPKIIYERSEYQELDEFIEARREEDVGTTVQVPPRPILIIGQPGIGEVVYRLAYM